MRISRDRMADWDAASNGDELLEIIPDRDYSRLQEDRIATLRIWLPEPAKLALDRVVERAELSMTAYLTEYFTAYLYGYYELLRMRENRCGLYVERKETAQYSRQGLLVPEPPYLGKNIYPLKIHLRTAIKEDLKLVANSVRMPLGECLRRLICSHLFGRKYALPSDLSFTPEERDAIAEWESESEE